MTRGRNILSRHRRQRIFLIITPPGTSLTYPYFVAGKEPCYCRIAHYVNYIVLRLPVIPWRFASTEVRLLPRLVNRRALLNLSYSLSVIHDTFLNYSHLIWDMNIGTQQTVSLVLLFIQALSLFSIALLLVKGRI